jgi:hypothetical protein
MLCIGTTQTEPHQMISSFLQGYGRKKSNGRALTKAAIHYDISRNPLSPWFLPPFRMQKAGNGQLP